MQQLASCVCRPPVRRTGGWAPRDGVEGNLRVSFLLALDAELSLYRNCIQTMKWESRLGWRNLDMILFFQSVHVKENRKILSAAGGLSSRGNPVLGSLACRI
jgi:hypothetical protein